MPRGQEAARPGAGAAVLAGRPARVFEQGVIKGKSHQYSCPRSELPGTDMPAIEGELVLGADRD
jgi:hypothetical protein